MTSSKHDLERSDDVIFVGHFVYIMATVDFRGKVSQIKMLFVKKCSGLLVALLFNKSVNQFNFDIKLVHIFVVGRFQIDVLVNISNC